MGKGVFPDPRFIKAWNLCRRAWHNFPCEEVQVTWTSGDVCTHHPPGKHGSDVAWGPWVAIPSQLDRAWIYFHQCMVQGLLILSAFLHGVLEDSQVITEGLFVVLFICLHWNLFCIYCLQLHTWPQRPFIIKNTLLMWRWALRLFLFVQFLAE